VGQERYKGGCEEEKSGTLKAGQRNMSRTLGKEDRQTGRGKTDRDGDQNDTFKFIDERGEGIIHWYRRAPKR